MNKILLPIIFLFIAHIINASTINPDSSYCYWYDLSIEFWENQNRRHYEYNDNEQIVLEIKQNWNAAINDWENFSKFESIYNDEDYVSEYKVSEWETDWIYDWRETFEYNANGFVTLWTYQYWDETAEEWNGGEQYEYSYNSINLETTKIYREWDGNSSEFTDVSKWLSTYENNTLSLKVFQEFQNSTWVNSYRNVYSYNDENYLISNVKQFWNEGTNRWDSNSKTYYEVDNNGNIIERVDQYWDSELEIWVNEVRYVYEFERDSLQILEERQTWNDTIWVSDWKNEFSFNSSGLKTEFVYTNYNQVTEEWENITKNLYSYEGQELTEIVTLSWDIYQSDWINDFKTSYTGPILERTELFENWDTIREDWVYENKCVDYYSWNVGIAGIKNEIEEISIHPNPVKNHLIIQQNLNISEVRIYNIEGKHIGTCKDKNLIPVHNLSKGLYFIQVKTIDEKYYKGKFIKN